ncbi:MAG TPA: M20/M25/M40 family metallo-hydrolase, partial [Gemmatimonadaceae bacterium]|nr:M20/M25/M40 family metallo-hydrolase [Gemmatimonadaceae bacterium]
MMARFVVGLVLIARAAGAQGYPVDSAFRMVDTTMRAEAVRRLAEYIRINTTNPPGNELATARWLEGVLAAEGIEGQILDTAELGPGRANFYARLSGDGSKHGAIALVSHMDVVPVSSEFWSVDPFAGVVKDGYVWGRGALDMKGHAITQLMAMIALKRSGVPLARDVVFIANADEEADGTGAITFVERHRDLLDGVQYLLTESADTRVEHGRVKWFGIDVAEKRPFWQRLTVVGTASHGSVPTPDNPVPRLVRALARVANWETPIRLTPAVDRFFKAQAAYETPEHRRWLGDVAAALGDPRGRAWLVSDPDRNALLRNTVSITVLTGSNKTNTIPEQASAELDIRLFADQDTARFRRQLVRVIGDPRVKVETMAEVPPAFSAPLDTELYRDIADVARAMVPGAPIATPMSTGASDRPTYAEAGIICYGVDPWLVEIEDN